MIDRRGQVWMFDAGPNEWAVAVVISQPSQFSEDGSVMHECIQLAGDDYIHFVVGCTFWHEYDYWDKNPLFVRLV